MQKKIKVNALGIAGIAVLLALLVVVRIFERQLFYDPLLAFFDAKGQPLPQYNGLKLFLGLLLRYVLNMVFSLGIIWLVFKDRAVLRLCVLLYATLFILLTAVFFIVLTMGDPNLLLLFYIRRFLIQPLFLILFLPAFYYQNTRQE